jgi:hypothetical protein
MNNFNPNHVPKLFRANYPNREGAEALARLFSSLSYVQPEYVTVLPNPRTGEYYVTNELDPRLIK